MSTRQWSWIPIVPMIFFTILFAPGSRAQGQDLPDLDDLILWLDASDSSTLFQDAGLSVPAQPGDPIGGWLDKSGFDYHATQPNDLARPDFDEVAMNGMPAVSFNSAEMDGLFIDDGLNLIRPYTVFIVNQYDGPIGGRTLQSQDTNWLHGLWAGNAASFAGDFVSINWLAEDNFVYVADTTQDIGGVNTFYLNGLDRTRASAAAGEPGRLGLGAAGVFAAEVGDADVSEILIYERVLDSTELGLVRDYLYTKYNATMLEEPVPPNPFNTIISPTGEAGAFTGGDPEDGLDFQGAFVYAVDVGGFGGGVVGDVEFTDGSIAGMEVGESPGVSINAPNEIAAWHAPDYGDSFDDDGLELAMQSIRFGGFDVDLEVDPGTYQVQLLFAESCCDRGFDITIEGKLAVDNLHIPTLQGGINNTIAGAFYRDTVSVNDGQLNIHMAGPNELASDNNPILNAFTLELIGPPALDGDYNGNGELDAGDLDLQASEGIAKQDLTYDLTGDGQVDFDGDRIEWLHNLKGVYVGDANLDGEFNTGDFVLVLGAGKYETQQPAGWVEGDWNGDGVFGTNDLVVALSDGGYEIGPFPGGVQAIPEPSGWLLSVMAACSLLMLRRW